MLSDVSDNKFKGHNCVIDQLLIIYIKSQTFLKYIDKIQYSLQS